MFLSTLYHFRNIRGKNNSMSALDDWISRCGHKSWQSRPTQSASWFNWSDLWVISSLADITSDLRIYVSQILNFFVIKYAEELGFSEEDLECKFAKMFDLVKACSYPLFVGVDDFDSPSRKLSLAAPKSLPVMRESFPTAQEVENLLDSCFWRLLMASGDDIDKLWVTGSLLINYPSLEITLNAVPDGVCGFTEEEALYFARSLLDETPDITNLRRFCGSYAFSPQSTAAQSLIHPRLLINRILKLSLVDAPLHKDPFELLSSILEVLPEESDTPGAVMLNDLIELLATGTVDISGQAASPFDLAANKTPTWSDLHFAGAFTYDGRSGGALRIASRQALSLVGFSIDVNELSLTVWIRARIYIHGRLVLLQRTR
ncbi:hypothetical protein K438DRAFT_633359 [Mycena galopus ATCC 62051]|nr:hypothetical protein K438DRAFT_633359 [Mycena galopus ATCC 62051]